MEYMCTKFVLTAQVVFSFRARAHTRQTHNVADATDHHASASAGVDDEVSRDDVR